MYRKYPIRGTSSHIFTDGVELPQALITSIQISVPYAYRDVYICKIFGKDGFVSILLKENLTNLVLGSFSGQITESNQLLTLDSLFPNVSGSITIGNAESVSSLNGSHYLTYNDGVLEGSTVFCFATPAVTSINVKDKVVTGFVSLIGENITFTENSQEILLSVTNPNVILSKNDFSGVFDNCNSPLIKKINTVTPDSNGNIDIYGILPVVISVSAGKIEFDTPTLTIPDVCPEKRKLAPPVNNSDDYYTDIETNKIPEWKSWPEFS